jgi:hypothetical protein
MAASISARLNAGVCAVSAATAAIRTAAVTTKRIGALYRT